MSTAIPDGYMRNASGHLVPEALVREHDKLRDSVARAIGNRAVELNRLLAEFKRESLNEIEDLVRIAGDKYQVELGGKKGNVTIATYAGDIKVLRSVADKIAFTEEIKAAEALIRNCLARWSEGANAKLLAVIDRAFTTSNKGQLKTSAVLDLLRIEVDDEEWERAMQAIRDSIQSIGTATYVRVYRRVGESDQYEAVPLDLAAV